MLNFNDCPQPSSTRVQHTEPTVAVSQPFDSSLTTAQGFENFSFTLSDGRVAKAAPIDKLKQSIGAKEILTVLAEPWDSTTRDLILLHIKSSGDKLITDFRAILNDDNESDMIRFSAADVLERLATPKSIHALESSAERDDEIGLKCSVCLVRLGQTARIPIVAQKIAALAPLSPEQSIVDAQDALKRFPELSYNAFTSIVSNQNQAIETRVTACALLGTIPDPRVPAYLDHALDFPSEIQRVAALSLAPHKSERVLNILLNFLRTENGPVLRETCAALKHYDLDARNLDPCQVIGSGHASIVTSRLCYLAEIAPEITKSFINGLSGNEAAAIFEVLYEQEEIFGPKLGLGSKVITDAIWASAPRAEFCFYWLESINSTNNRADRIELLSQVLGENTIELETKFFEASKCAATTNDAQRLQSYAQALHNARLQGVKHPFRFDELTLVKIFCPKPTVAAESSPHAVIILPDYDHNGAFYHASSVFNGLAQHYNITVREVSEDWQLEHALKSAARLGDDSFHPVDLLIIGGHGSPTSIAFGKSDVEEDGSLDLDLSDIARLRSANLDRAIKQGATVVLMSCEVGTGRDSSLNMANALTAVFPNAAKIISPTDSYFNCSTEFLYNQKGQLECINYGGGLLIASTFRDQVPSYEAVPGNWRLLKLTQQLLKAKEPCEEDLE